MKKVILTLAIALGSLTTFAANTVPTTTIEIVTNIQDEYINQHVSAAQITNTIRLSRFFLVSIVIVSLYIYCIYQF